MYNPYIPPNRLGDWSRNPGFWLGFLLYYSQMKTKETYVYIDNFNMYYGILKNNRKVKWLDLDAWLKTQLPVAGYDIQKIKVFSAKVTAPLHDLQKPVRQSIYFRALRTLPNIELILGRYQKKNIGIQITSDVRITGRTFEEKGTDVNLAVHLVNDAHLDRFETAVVISNDSDLAEAIAITARDLGKEVWVINPCEGKPSSKRLTQHASQIRDIRVTALQLNQFSPNLTDSVGTFTKPSNW